MWETRFVLFPLTGPCATLILIFFVKVSALHAQVPPFNFGRTATMRSSPFPDVHPISPDGELSSRTAGPGLWEGEDKSSVSEEPTSNGKKGEGPEEPSPREGPAGVRSSRRPREQGTHLKERGSPGTSGKRFDDGYGKAATIRPYTLRSLRRENVCRHSNITLHVDSPGDMVMFHCGSTEADLRPGLFEVFLGSSCSGPPVLLCTIIPGAMLLNQLHSKGGGWTLSVGELPSVATTLCYQCQVVSDEGVTSSCNVIINVAAADPMTRMDTASDGEKSASPKRALLKVAALVTVALTLAL